MPLSKIDAFATYLKKSIFSYISPFRKIRAEICQAAENDWKQVNVTLGIAVYDSENDPAVIDVARRADQQMYENKRIRKEKRRKMS